MLDTVHLEPLLRDLRHAGLRVGVHEVQQIHRVVSLLDGATPGPARIRNLLAAVLVKSAGQRTLFNAAYERWQRDVDRDLEALEATPPEPRPAPVPVPHRPDVAVPRRLRYRKGILALALVFLAAGILAATVFLRQGYDEALADAARRPLPEEAPDIEPTGETSTEEVPMRERTFAARVPTLNAEERSFEDLKAALFLLSLAGLAGLWVHRSPVHEAKADTAADPEKTTDDNVPLARILPATDEDPPPLLGFAERELMVWGLDHYFAEGEQSRFLDLPASVEATARAGGFPRLLHHPPKRQRQVWLWLDESCEDPAAEALAEEIEAALRAQHLPVARATYWGVPDHLTHTDGTRFQPREIEERRGEARVALLTDGRRLHQLARRGGQRAQVEARLRDLSHWPRLAVVGFGEAPDLLAGLLRRHQIDFLAPDELAGFVGGSPQPRTPTRDLDEDLLAAATALCPAPFELSAAAALGRELGLQVSAWALQRLQRRAAGPGSRLLWSDEERVELLERLRTFDASTDGRASLQQRAVAFWLHHYDTELGRRLDPAGASEPEPESPALHLLRAEREWVALFDTEQRSAAIASLYRLATSAPGLKSWLESRLRRLTTLDDPRPGFARLGVRDADLSRVDLARLLRLGFAPGRYRRQAQPPARRRLALGLLAGLGLGALLWGLGESLRTDPRIENPPEPVVSWRQPGGNSGARVTVATRRGQVSRTLEPGQQAVIARWNEEPVQCIEKIGEDYELWRCPRLPPEARIGDTLAPRSGEPSRVVVALETPLRAPMAERLALRLLDSGSADLVLLGEDAHREMATYLPPAGSNLAFRGWSIDPSRTTPAWQALPEAEQATAEDLWKRLDAALLRLQRQQLAAEVWPWVELSDHTARLQGYDASRRVELEMVAIPAGSVVLGTLPTDPGAEMARPDEKTNGEVLEVEAFRMGTTEVTHRQYKALFPNHETYWDENFSGDTSDLPVTDVSLYDAKAFCEALGFRLPTEKEWEYAARADQRTPWWFGSDESKLGEYAWYRANSDIRPHDVGQLRPNPFGLYDMHGNAWEWVDSEYLSFEDGSVLQRCGDKPCSVLRGGSYWDEPRDVRSALRYRGWPGFSFRNFGFRCVRGAHPQP